MASSRLVLIAVTCLLGSGALAQQPSAVEVLQDMYNACVSDFSVSCVKPKALAWMSNVVDQPVIKITEDLVVVKSAPQDLVEEQRGASEDIFDKFEDFLDSHRLVAKVPSAFKNGGALSDLVPRSFEAEDVDVPLAATGRSRLVKKVLVPFLLGLKFKTAVLVPLALALIALKTWKALTLGLLSLVLTGALVIFKISKPKITTYEVVHYPQHVEHHVEHPAPTGWEHQGPYHQQKRSAQEQAYNAYAN